MAKYMKTAKEANKSATQLYELVTSNHATYLNDEQYRSEVACLIARLVNYGLRCSPRPCQSTVRLNAVKEAVKGLPVLVTMVAKTDEKTGFTYNALVTTPKITAAKN